LVGFEQTPLDGSHVPAVWQASWAVQVTGAPAQLPALQASFVSQGFPSLHAVPSATAGFEHWPELGSHVPGAWHWSDAVQTTAPLPAQLPDRQLSVAVQALPSLQAVPSARVGFEHWPELGSQVPAEWHWSDAVQVTGLPAAHVPLWHVSTWVQALPSLHAVPLEAAGLVHWPVEGSHAPATWHWSEAVQVTGFDPVHAPLWQASAWVQALPSLHGVPLEAAGLVHCPVVGSHVPATWHWSKAVQATWLPALQTPAWQVSFRSHALPSLQAVPSATAGLLHCPVVGLQAPAAWHESEAVQVTGFDPTHAPAWQVSFCVQALPSLHAVPFAAVEQTEVHTVSGEGVTATVPLSEPV
jgi:hypothetical protein